jgi:hypothetical protein
MAINSGERVLSRSNLSATAAQSFARLFFRFLVFLLKAKAMEIDSTTRA